MMPTIIAIVVIMLTIFFSARHIYKEKKRGAKCIGCPMSGSCSKRH